MRRVEVISNERAEEAIRYTKLLANQPFAFFVSVLPRIGDDETFDVFVGGPRKLGSRTIRLGVQGVLDAAVRRGEIPESRRFEVTARGGYIGRAVWATGSGPATGGAVHALRKLQDSPMED